MEKRLCVKFQESNLSTSIFGDDAVSAVVTDTLERRIVLVGGSGFGAG